MGFKSNKELIIELKKVIKEKDIGQTELMKMMEEHGHPLGKTTIQRLYTEGSEENDSFRYKDTLQPLAELLLDNAPALDPVIELQDRIDRMEDQLNKYHDLISRYIELSDAQIKIKDTRMERKDQWLSQLMEENKRLNDEVCKLLDRCNRCDKK